MATNKQISLEDVRRNPKLLERFIAEHRTKGDRARFEAVLDAMCEPIKTPPKGDQT